MFFNKKKVKKDDYDLPSMDEMVKLAGRDLHEGRSEIVTKLFD